MIDSVPEYVASTWYATNIVACIFAGEKCRRNIHAMRVAGFLLDTMSRQRSMCDRGIRFRESRNLATVWGSIAFAIASGNVLGFTLFKFFGN